MAQKNTARGSTASSDCRLGCYQFHTTPVALPCRDACHQGHNGSYDDPGLRISYEHTKGQQEPETFSNATNDDDDLQGRLAPCRYAMGRRQNAGLTEQERQSQYRARNLKRPSRQAYLRG